MRNHVIIEPWGADPKDVHVHEELSTQIHSRTGDLVNECTVQEVIQIGEISGRLRRVMGKDCYIDMNCREFCDMVEGVRAPSERHIANMRGCIEELFDCDEAPPIFSDLEIAWLDYEMRELLGEDARECDDPFSGKIVIERDPVDFINQYLIRRERSRDDRVAAD